MHNRNHTMQDAEHVQGRGIVHEIKGQLGCVRYHTEDTCIWQIDFQPVPYGYCKPTT